MNKLTLIWSLVVAVPVSASAIATGYIYRDTGRLPFQPPAETTAATSEEKGTADKQSVAAIETTLPVAEEPAAAPQPAEETAPLKGPSFDVVGVEPTGETVVAGRSDAGAIVALTANGQVVGKSIANQSGEWTIILDAPLKPGDYDVGLEVHDKAGEPVETSEQNLVVSVPEDGKEQPLVVLNTPEQPASILQKPEPGPQVVAAGQPQETPEQTAVDTQIAAVQDGPAEEAPVKPAVPEAAPEMADNPAEKGDQLPASATAPTTPAPVEEVAKEALPTPDAEPEAIQVAEEPVAPSATEDAGQAPEIAARQEAAPERIADESQPQTEQLVAAVDQKPQTGDTGPAFAPANAAAPQPKPGSATETASQGEPSVAEVQDIDVAARAAEPDQVVASDTTVTVEAVEAEDDKVYVAGTAEPGSSVRVYVDDDYQGEAKVSETGKWLIQGTKKVLAGDVEVRADVIAADGSSVEARAAVTFEKEADQQIVLTRVIATGVSGTSGGQGAAVQKALPKVIIRKGDNLWRISRRLYGDGIRYTTIYRANEDQIRNPDLIYPGQVFLTPEGDLGWQPTPDDAEGAAGNG